jgi:hypothetical protein
MGGSKCLYSKAVCFFLHRCVTSSIVSSSMVEGHNDGHYPMTGGGKGSHAI